MNVDEYFEQWDPVRKHKERRFPVTSIMSRTRDFVAQTLQIGAGTEVQYCSSIVVKRQFEEHVIGQRLAD